MARDKTAASESASISAQFAAAMADLEDDSIISGLPPTRMPFVRSARGNVPVADLTHLTKVIMLIGPGGSGKTVVSRWLGEQLIEHGKQDRAVIAALDPSNRSLASFIATTIQPPSSDSSETVKWLQDILRFISTSRMNGILDFGGGDVSLARTIELMPTLADAMENEGVALIPTYLLTPRIDDLAPLEAFERLGFRPRATMLVLNLKRAKTPAAFDALRRHRVYKAALDRGAVEIWLPELEEDVALRIERPRAQFRQARDGEVASLAPFERYRVREFLERMRAEFEPVEGWMPWQ